MVDVKKIRTWAQVVISAILLIFSIYIIIIEPADSSKLKWAFGIIGIIIGYWLK
jgi:hypothetical protein